MRKIKIRGVGGWSIVEYPDYFMKPFNEGYYSEAFTVMDCFIDYVLRDIVVAIFCKSKEQDLFYNLQEIARIRGKLLAEFLTKIGAMESDLKGKISNFKNARNDITHELSGHFALLLKEKEYYKKYKTQEEVETEVDIRIHKAFNEGKEAYYALHRLLRKINKDGGDKFHEELSQKMIKSSLEKKTD